MPSNPVSTGAECGALLGFTKNSVVTMKRHGTDRRTALACAALLAGLAPYGEEPAAKDAPF